MVLREFTCVRDVWERPIPTCTGVHVNPHLYEVRTCPQISVSYKDPPHHKVFTPPVPRSEWKQKALVLFSSVGERKKRRGGRERFLPRRTSHRPVQRALSNCGSLAVAFTCSSYQSNVPSVVKCTTQPWKILAVYQTSMRHKFKALAWQ